MRINKRLISTTFTSSGPYRYSGSAQGATLTVSNVIAGDSVTIGVSLTRTAPTPSAIVSEDSFTVTTASATKNYTAVNAGTYTATVTGLSGTSSENYDWAASSNTFVIRTKGLTVTSVPSKVYDGNANVTGSVSVTGLVGSDTVASLSLTATYDNKNAGTNKNVTVTIANTNYSINGTDGGSAQSTTYASGVITPAPLTVAVTEAEDSVYNGAASAIFTVTVSGIVSGEKLTLQYTYAGSDPTMTIDGNPASFADGFGSFVIGNQTFVISEKDANDYFLILEGFADATVSSTTYLASNYTFDATSASYDVTIEKKTVTATWNYSSPFEYDGTSKTVTATLDKTGTAGTEASGKVYAADAASVNLILANNSKIRAGVYTATATLSDSTGNYELGGTTNLEWEITKRELGLAFSGTNTVTYDGAAHSVTLTASRVIAGDSVTVNVSISSGASGSNVTVSGGATSQGV